MNKNSKDINKNLRLTRKQITGIAVLIAASFIIITFVNSEIDIGQSGAQMDPMAIHLHPELKIVMDSKSLTVPSNIGINSSLWNAHSLDKYGMQAMPEMGMSSMAPLHTHDDSGIIHVESSINRNYTLGEFLEVWGLKLDNKIVKSTVDNKSITNFETIVLKDGEKINLDITDE
ncbi:MAG: hypothetical protein AB7V56_10230 [Candidatus Nitrosocosmicus sp.]